jgi:hypothetical protein
MRLIALAATALAVLTCGVAFQPAEAREQRKKPLRVTVEQRSFLDAGRIAPVGAYNRHIISAHYLATPAYGFGPSRLGTEALPSAIGSGRNPFANSFFGPSLR